MSTCNAGGAGKWSAEHPQCLTGREVVVVPDADEAGEKHARQVAEACHSVAQSVRILNLPELSEKGDVSDWLNKGGSKDALLNLAEQTQVWTPRTAETGAWPEIESLEPEKPEFPTSVLPEPLRMWVVAESHATQTPPDLAALLALAVCSAAIARRVEVQPWNGWTEPTNLFVAVLLEPGNRKSAVFKDALRPLKKIEVESIEAARPDVARQKSEQRQANLRLKRLEKIAGEKADETKGREAAQLAAELAEWPEPLLPRLVVDDATTEKLVTLLADQGNRIASMSAEGSVFDLMAGQYSKNGGAQFVVYLMGHSGDDLIVDRVTRPSLNVPKPALTCAYAIQPEVIRGIADNPAFRGRGLLGRFLYSAPRSWIGERIVRPELVPEELHASYEQTIRKLADIPNEVTLKLSNDASVALTDWAKEIEKTLADGGDMELIRDWGGKLLGATARLAAVMHCVSNDFEAEINELTIEAAIEIARFLIPHADYVLRLMVANGRDQINDAVYVLNWIKRYRKTEFTKRDAQQHGKRRFPKANDIDPVLLTLTEHGYIRQGHQNGRVDADGHRLPRSV